MALAGQVGRTQYKTVGAIGAVTDDTAPSALVFYDTAGPATDYTLNIVGGELIFASTGDTSLPDDLTNTPGTIDPAVATVDTFGEFADIVNATNFWKCHLVGAIRSQATSWVDDLSSATTSPDTAPLSLHFDISAAKVAAICIGPEMDSSLNALARNSAVFMSQGRILDSGKVTSFSMRYARSVLDYVQCEGGNAGGNAVIGLNIYSSSQSADNLIWDVQVIGNDTNLVILAALLQGIMSNEGERLVIQCLSTSTPDSLLLITRGRFGNAAELTQ